MKAYEASRASEALDDIADWLDRSSAPPVLNLPLLVHRIPVAIIQSESLSAEYL
jgi:hypothetical protein